MRSDTNKCYFEKKNIYYLDFDQGPAEKALLAHHWLTRYRVTHLF